jgi:hypothetical protein
MKQFAVLSRNPDIESVFNFIRQHELAHEVHLNRTRFWIADGPVLTEFYLRFNNSFILRIED